MNAPIVCIFGTLHEYQYQTPRKKYFQNIKCLIDIHSVDIVVEEASGLNGSTYAKKIADIAGIPWQNVDLSGEERKYVPDLNPYSRGTQVDFDLHWFREWIWVIRTAKAIRNSALLICGLAHTTGVADKFWSLGFKVETHVYLDEEDDKLIQQRVEQSE